MVLVDVGLAESVKSSVSFMPTIILGGGTLAPILQMRKLRSNFQSVLKRLGLNTRPGPESELGLSGTNTWQELKHCWDFA